MDIPRVQASTDPSNPEPASISPAVPTETATGRAEDMSNQMSPPMQQQTRPAAGTAGFSGTMPADWLPVVMQGSYSEIYVLDRVSLRFLYANQAARRNLQYGESELAVMSLRDVVSCLPADQFAHLMQALQLAWTAPVTLDTTLARRDGSSYPIELRIFHCASEAAPALIVIGNDISERQDTAKALWDSEASFRVIVANTPGLVYQFLRDAAGKTSFTYLSAACQALLGIGVEQLYADATLFESMILPEDRDSYRESMAVSAKEMIGWNWEGRIWIEEWQDTKWINLRATPRNMVDGSVQWKGIMTNITQSKVEEAEIKRSRKQLAELSAHVETVKEQERTRISREIHDDLGGNLTAIKMALALLTRRMPQDDADLVQKAVYVDALVDRTIESIHRIAGDLRPSVLDFGLVAAIEWQAKEFEKQVGVPCEFSTNQKDIALHQDQATALFRIFQEALTNIAKHAQASRVTVKLLRSNRSVRLDICDDGKGINPADTRKPKSFGIRGMMERAIALGGKLSVEPGVDGGSLVSIKIPLAGA
ncbi:N/A [soil metagenome]